MKQQAKNAQSWPQLFLALTPSVKRAISSMQLPPYSRKEANVNTQDENQNNQNSRNEVEDLMLRRHPLPKPATDGSAEMK